MHTDNLFETSDVSPEIRSLYALSVNGPGNGWAVGHYGLVRIWKLSGLNTWNEISPIIIGLNENTQIKPELICYPNPAESYTNISVFLNNKTELFLSLHSLNGQKIQDIFLGIKQKGTHQFTINCSNFSKGIYLVKAQVGKEIETIKLIVN